MKSGTCLVLLKLSLQNLKVYFKSTSIELTTDVYDIEEWQGGDIVVFKKHIGIISDKRNKSGIPFVIHHANPYQIRYEEDILCRFYKRRPCRR